MSGTKLKAYNMLMTGTFVISIGYTLSVYKFNISVARFLESNSCFDPMKTEREVNKLLSVKTKIEQKPKKKGGYHSHNLVNFVTLDCS